MSKKIIHTDQAPAAIGTYSQAVRHGNLVFLSGQIPLVPETMELVGGSFEDRVRRVLDNLDAVCQASGGSLQDIIKLTVFLTNMDNFARVNTVMGEYFSKPYPARAAVGVASLPKAADVEMEAVLGL